jgi:anti-anti-sigma factor
MTNDRSTRHDGSVKGRGRRSPRLRAGRNIEQQVIAVERSGDWLPAEELREAALAALLPDKDVILNLDGVDHLDASALQILLALHAAQKKQGGNVHLVKASRQLRKWFEFAAADGRFFHG